MNTLSAYARGALPALGVTLIWWTMDYLMGQSSNYWLIFIVSLLAAGWANLIAGRTMTAPTENTNSTPS